MERKVTRYEVVDRVAWLTLDRPDRLNAWTGRMHLEYRAALTEAEADDGVRVVVVTGAGRGFCAGADSRALSGHADRGGYDDGLRGETPPTPPVDPGYVADFAFQLGMSTPVIAAVNGPAAGVGLVIACYADLRFAAAGAKLTTAAPALGLPAEYGLSWLLPRLIGAGRAADLLLSGRVVLAEEAERMGLVNAVLPAGELLDHVRRYAHDLAHHVSPSALIATKRQLWDDVRSHDVVRSVDRAGELLRELAAGPEFAEGARALAERRRPVF